DQLLHYHCLKEVVYELENDGGFWEKTLKNVFGIQPLAAARRLHREMQAAVTAAKINHDPVKHLLKEVLTTTTSPGEESASADSLLGKAGMIKKL
ncbi:unnamed protein product, partial [Amoebophrya sp. A25]